jgi:hypothetical protein
MPLPPRQRSRIRELAYWLHRRLQKTGNGIPERYSPSGDCRESTRCSPQDSSPSSHIGANCLSKLRGQALALPRDAAFWTAALHSAGEGPVPGAHHLHVDGPSLNLPTQSSTTPSKIKRRTISLTEISVNSTNALPCFDFFGCDCRHLGRSVDLVASLLVNSGFCRVGFWYAVHQVLVFPGRPVATTSGISHFLLFLSCVIGNSGGTTSSPSRYNEVKPSKAIPNSKLFNDLCFWPLGQRTGYPPQIASSIPLT